MIYVAFKRAALAKPSSASSSTTQLRMKPVETRRRMPRHSILVVLGLVWAVGLGVFFVIKGLQASFRVLTHNLGDPVPVLARERPAPPPEPADAGRIADRQIEAPSPSALIPPMGGATGTETSPTSTPADSAPGTAPAAVAAAAQPLAPVSPGPAFPKLKLQGIFYRPTNPSVVINAQTLYRGETIQQARVIEITQKSATLLWEGETKVLTLE